MSDVEIAVTRLAREESGHVLALLAHRFKDLDLADEAVQDALLTALSTWPVDGIPNNPAGWLHTVARNRAIDRLRRESTARRRLLAAGHELIAAATPPPEEPEMIVDYSEVGDEHLRLLLLCCHPALDRDSQVALTLRLAGGLTTQEIAAALMIPEPTLAQRVVRAKRKIRDAGIPLSVPAALDERIGALLTVIYIIFNEGYLSRVEADPIRVDLVDQAIRLTRQAGSLLPDNAEIDGLLALELYSRSRIDARFVADELVLLEQQDRARWDAASIDAANVVLSRALTRMTPGPFQLQALIASQHANASSSSETDWPMIATLYGQLAAVSPSPVVELNRAVAVAMADGANAGLAVLENIAGLGSYYLFWATRGELLVRTDREAEALAAFDTALGLARNTAERKHLKRRIDELR